MVTTRPPKTIVKPTALGPVANTDTKLLIYGLFQKGRVLAQDGLRFAHWLLFYRSERLAQTIADFTFSGSESPKSDILESQLATSLEGRDESASNDEIMPTWCWQIED